MKEQSEKLFRAIGDVGDDLIARALSLIHI